MNIAPCPNLAGRVIDMFCLALLGRSTYRAPIPCAIWYIASMARGISGRIVVHMDPFLKRSLYIQLATKNTTLKDWLVGLATDACIIKDQRFTSRISSLKKKTARGSE